MSEKTEKNYFRAQMHHYLLYFPTSQTNNPTTQNVSDTDKDRRHADYGKQEAIERKNKDYGG